MSVEINNSVLHATTRRVAQAVMFFVVAIVLAILVEWVGMNTLWRDEGVEHSRRMVSSELQALSLTVRPGARAGEIVTHTLAEFVGAVQYWLIDRSRLRSALHATRDWALVKGLADYLEAAINAIEAFVLRLAVVILALPAFVLVGIYAGVEGLTRRALRRYGGGHETAYLFHHGKRLLWPSIFLPTVLYLSAPTPLSPLWVYAPALTLFAIGVMVTTSKFKKFL